MTCHRFLLTSPHLIPFTIPPAVHADCRRSKIAEYAYNVHLSMRFVRYKGEAETSEIPVQPYPYLFFVNINVFTLTR